MAAFIQNSITAAGLAVLTKGAAGETIRYTRIVLGDGYIPDGQTAATMTGVVSPTVVLDISAIRFNADGTVTVSAVFHNAQNETGFYYRELGLYAEDPDPAVGEVLYCYGNCGEQAEFVPPSNSVSVIEKTVNVVTAIGAAKNVTAYIPSDACATVEDYERYLALVNAAYAMADEALAIARQALASATESKAMATENSNHISQHCSKIAIMWDALFGDITGNPFMITFENLNGVTVSSGVWNESLQRLEC